MPATAIDSGHFTDPYPVDVRASGDGRPLTVFSGTSDEIAVCEGAIVAGCFSADRIDVRYSAALTSELRRNGDAPVLQANHNIVRLPDGRWEMALTVEIRHHSSEWKVDLNAQPAGGATVDGVPTTWVAGAILVGSPTTPAKANYDAKYLSADGALYLVYSRHLADPPDARDGLVAQRMTSPTQPAASTPVTLLAPSSRDGGLRSERVDPSEPGDRDALVETGNIEEIGSVWVLVYSTGTVDRTDYKIGVAYADSPVPVGGYSKVLVPDPGRVWGSAANEVEYLLQSQEPAWPNYAGGAVQAPGVGSIVDRGGRWYLFFAADAPSQPQTARGTLDPHLRNLYEVPLEIRVPDGSEPVQHATGRQLARWITPEL